MKKSTFLSGVFGIVCALAAHGQNTFPPVGNAGIGTLNPQAHLDLIVNGNSPNTYSGFRLTTPSILSTTSPLTTAFQIRRSGFSNSFYSLFVVKPNGNIGIGVEPNDPLLASRRLVVTDNNVNKVDLNVKGFALVDGQSASVLFGGTGGEQYGQWGIEYNQYATTPGLNFWKPAGSNNFGNYYMFMADNGKISMGLDPNNTATYNGDYRLYVKDGIMTEKVKVAVHTTNDWADYVFKKDYSLMPLNEVERFISQNGHLPNIPSAENIVNEGIDIAKMDAKLLEKIEELTLYIIEQDKRIAELENQSKND